NGALSSRGLDYLIGHPDHQDDAKAEGGAPRQGGHQTMLRSCSQGRWNCPRIWGYWIAGLQKRPASQIRARHADAHGVNPRERHAVSTTPLSVCIITYNEEENLPRCLASVAFADEIVVVDSQSTDRTVAIARQAGCRVISQAFLGYMAQKNLALQYASHQWVLCLDADEWLRSGAAATIQAALATRTPDVAGYTLKRHTYYLGDWVNHGGWWPEYKIRLFDRQRGQWYGDALHEGIRVAGRVDPLEVEIGHRSYKDIAHHFSKINTYTTIM